MVLKKVITLQLAFKKINKTMVVSMSGELDHHNAVSVRDEIDRRFQSSGCKNLVFDLEGLQFMDSSGLGIIIGRYKSVTAIGGKTCIAAPSSQAERLINLAGIYKIIPVWGSVDAAVHGT